MEFIPAGEIIGEAHQIRTVEIADSPQLPDGEAVPAAGEPPVKTWTRPSKPWLT